ncbi:hypothetical protein C5167_011295 [Papaver somniferum]|uniref:Uncharacterized protein n=1 Tax=Papaver somniferum TaxID=3469 RepID=A0A4Y7K461_PAPSO|nr:hypothetical protein C5167_011295 [Papaver somniferum]
MRPNNRFQPRLYIFAVMEGVKVLVPCRILKVIEHTRIQQLIETSTEHNTVPELRRSPKLLSNLEFEKKMDMINERKRQRCHHLDPHQRAYELQQRRILERAKQNSMTIHEREAFLEKRRNQYRIQSSQQRLQNKNG